MWMLKLYKVINENATKNLYLTYAFLFAIAVLILKLIISGMNTTPDSIGYINTVEMLRGNFDPNLLSEYYFLRPLGSIIAFPSSYVFGVWNAFVIENSIMYLLSVIILFAIAGRLYSHKIALYASLLYASSPVLTTFGLAILQDMGIWFFYIGSVYLTLRFFGVDSSNKYNKPLGNFFIFSLGITVGLGVLMKESAIAGFFFFVLMLLFSKYHPKDSIGQKWKIIGIVFMGAVIPILINESITYTYFNISHLSLLQSGVSNVHTPVQTVYNFIKSFVMAFNILIPFFLIGAYREWKKPDHGNSIIFILLLISSLPIVIGYPLNATRFTFLIFPAIIPLAAYGISEIRLFIPNWLTNNNSIKHFDKYILILCVFANLVVTFYIGITDGGIFEQLELDLIK